MSAAVTPLLAGAGAGVGVLGPLDRLRDYWTALAALVGLTLLAYLTNPGPASFRTHVTSLSFHAHLRRCDSSSPARSPASAPSSSAQPGAAGVQAGQANGKDVGSHGNGHHGKRRGASGLAASDSRSAASRRGGPPDRHVLSFSNRISLSIKTHTYNYASYHLFSTVYVPSSRPASSTAGVKKQQQLQAQRKHPELSALLGLGGELWLGVFGNWYSLRLWASDNLDEHERRGRLEQGVKEMSVEDDEHDSDHPTYSAGGSTNATVSGASTPASVPLSHTSSTSVDHRNVSPLTSNSETAPPPSPTSKSALASSRLSKRVFRAGQRRSSPTSLTRLKNKAEHAAREAAEAERAAADEAGAGGGVGAKGGLGAGPPVAAGDGFKGLTGSAASDPILVELQAQLDELRASAAETEQRLQDELEVLRGKKRDEDAFRAELKAKTKSLEEAKRLAEASRSEAEKELNERRSVIKEAQARVDKLRDEIRALERKGLEAVERKEKKKRERKEREKKLRDDVIKKRDELKDKEKALDEVLQKVGEMERKLEVRRALLAGRRTELAQMGFAGGRGVGGPVGGMYSMAPPHLVPATATLGGVGAVANAFAAPFGGGAYGRRNYPYVHPLSANNSRPTSIRSGHFDPHTGAFQSAPSSPTLAAMEDPSPYGAGADASGWPTSFPAAPNGGANALPQTGFLEHRMQHRAAHAQTGDDSASHFLPFGFDGLAPVNEPSPPPRSARAGSLTGSLDDSSPGGHASKPRTLALPLQYLDSGLLAGGTESPGLDGPLSPMTPHQASLIPSQLFHMLDDDDDDDGLFVVPDSPTLRAGVGLADGDWEGLGLDVNELGGSRRQSKEVEADQDQASPDSGAGHEEVESQEQEILADQPQSPAVVSPRSDSFPHAAAIGSTTTSPIGPPPSSPFSPWAAEPTAPSSATPSPAMTPASIAFDLGANKGLSAAPGSQGLHRLSPSQDLADDLPRAGLSLNPGAKAFAFPFAPSAAAAVGSATHTRTTSVPSPPSIAAAVRASRSGTASSFPGSSLPSPTAGSHSPVAPTAPSSYALSPPAKSRMEFARTTVGTDAAPLSARLSPGFDWPKSTSSPVFTAPVVAPVADGKVSTPGVATAVAFNPFDEEDELLGPLKM
ncbi:uncharacterized protein JCM10292_005561 [Rhodotorula paludigena]|uniref:uncharacterized protein n=1 Tax=Rhodotorula paludigena TaxID=86838 RepID=UPI003181701B